MSTTPKRRKKAAPKNFKAAYEILQRNATELQQQDTPDIDNLMTTVEESIAAYRVCEARINAVQEALDAAFAEQDASVHDHETPASQNS
ncbi:MULTISPECIES: exodeoxyribonuclease VII small subunit [unclassified Psychrobacter]|uniref:exodeoxyribonuclease VII small subunit n=1 Tax=unclassified Psychrobacter TaxID=196806 RepID=UPI0018F64494|nr:MULTISPECIES: exodeoxyribonuclease VII small subunit [unclassified Psychrobacter]